MNIALIHWCNETNFTISRQTSAWLTQRGNKVFMGTQGLHAALVLIVPDTQGLVISTAHNKSPTRMEQHSTHPVIMTDLRGERRKRWMKKEKWWIKAHTNLLYDSVDLVNGKSHFSVFLKKQFDNTSIKYRAVIKYDIYTVAMFKTVYNHSNAKRVYAWNTVNTFHQNVHYKIQRIVLGNAMQLFFNSIRNEAEGISCYFKHLFNSLFNWIVIDSSIFLFVLFSEIINSAFSIMTMSQCNILLFQNVDH